MQLFNLYLSGVRIGNIDFDTQDSISFRDPQTDQGREPTQEEHDALKRFGVLDVLLHFHDIPDVYKQKDSGEIVSSWGDVFEKEDHVLYFRRKKSGFDVHFDEEGLPFLFVIPRLSILSLLRDGYEGRTFLDGFSDKGLSEDTYTCKDLGTFMVPMRDGIQLATQVWIPNGIGSYPSILVRTPYNAQSNFFTYRPYIHRGYALVLQDVRGREDSQGVFDGSNAEMHDGSDTLDWIVTQNWSNGKIGTIGGSYCGGVQWQMAASGNQNLTCMVSMVTAGPAFLDVPRKGGALLSGVLPWALLMNGKRVDFVNNAMQRDDWDTIMKLRPLSKIPELAFGEKNPLWDNWMLHETDSEFWSESDWTSHQPITIPAMIESGWFDDDHFGSMVAWDIAHKFPVANKFLLLGPWLHNSNTTRDIHSVRLANNAIRYDVDQYWLRWLDYHLKGKETGFASAKPVQYYMVGADEWREDDIFPPTGFSETSLYFGSDGTLFEQPPTKEGSVCYSYDPENPAPHIIDLSENEISVPGEYTEMEKRSDVVTFTLPVSKVTELAGDVFAEFWASSSCHDTDWVVRVTEVEESGRSIQWSFGILRAKFRYGFDKMVPLSPGRPEKYQIRLQQFAKRFTVGTCIRVHITSSAENLAVPNDNTGNPLTASTQPIVAQQKIFFGGKTPSRIIVHSKTCETALPL